MAKASRDKGARRERELATILGAKRIGVAYNPGPDLVWRDRTIEVKARATGFAQLYKWLEGAPILGLKADRKPWLFVATFDEVLDLLDEAEVDGP